MEEVMRICEEALEKAGYEIYGYSEAYQHFTVRVGNEDVLVDFKED